jgi:hypothetical protein
MHQRQMRRISDWGELRGIEAAEVDPDPDAMVRSVGKLGCSYHLADTGD